MNRYCDIDRVDIFHILVLQEYWVLVESRIPLKPVLGGRKGAQWLSGRVLDSRPRGRGFGPHRRHCVVVLEQDTFILA